MPKWQDNNNQLQCRIGTISFFHTMGLDVSITFSPSYHTGFWEHIFPFSLSSFGVFHDGQSHISGIWNKSLPGGLGQREFPTKTATLLPGACALHTSRSPHSTPMEHRRVYAGLAFSSALGSQVFQGSAISQWTHRIYRAFIIFLAIDKESPQSQGNNHNANIKA